MTEKRSKLDSLYPERELTFGKLTVYVKAVPGLKAADLLACFRSALDTFTGSDWTQLAIEIWPKIRGIIGNCVRFDEEDVTLEDLSLRALGDIVEAVRQLTFETSDGGDIVTRPLAIAKIYGLELKTPPEPPISTESETTSQTSP